MRGFDPAGVVFPVTRRRWQGFADAWSAAEQAGIPVPAALAITGWDDTQAAAPAGLTTLAQSLRDQGIRCAELVLGTVTQGTRDDRADWHVVHRRSTREPPPLPPPS